MVEYCRKHCLFPEKQCLGLTSIESPKTSVQINIPTEYQDFKDVFSKYKASGLLPHCDYDCAINLPPGTTSPRGKICPLSCTEQKAMEEYIQEALEQQYIVPSTSPASAGFFFVGKKYRGLRPYIYNGVSMLSL